ncbi:MAG: hypothetical protein DWG74_01615 [Chloroflexi bacterium]|nr:hypothetical protein [Chloroflexota bacterium]
MLAMTPDAPKPRPPASDATAAPDTAAGPHPREPALNAWLVETRGIDRPRRIVRVDDERILVSKFEPGFAARLHELLDLMPELFDEASVVAAYEARASAAPPETPRTAAWHDAMHTVLRAAGERHAIPDLRQAEVRTGIDSVYAVLDSVLWSTPTVGDGGYEPARGEISAYRDGLDRLEPTADLFTRHYGEFDGRDVVNHCPGASFARLMLEQAWRACTGTAPPA